MYIVKVTIKMEFLLSRSSHVSFYLGKLINALFRHQENTLLNVVLSSEGNQENRITTEINCAQVNYPFLNLHDQRTDVLISIRMFCYLPGIVQSSYAQSLAAKRLKSR